MDLGLKDRVAFVAGASSGLGRAAARVLASEGARVALCSRSDARIQRAASEIAEATGVASEQLLPLVCDVTDEAQVERAIQQTTEHFGALHVLLTNAGGPPAGRIADFDTSDWHAALELNLMSTIYLCRAVRPALRRAAAEDDHARIVMVTSVAAKQPVPTLPLSNTARAGVHGFAKSLAEEVGPHGITVNTLLPGYTRTARLEDLAEKQREDTNQSVEDIEDGWAEQNALKRLGEPEEFAAAVAFLASRPAAYITGAALPVDGGRSKHLL